MAIQTTTTVRGWWKEYRCSSRTDVTKNDPNFQLWGKTVGGVPILATQAFRALEMALTATGYVPSQSVWVERTCAQGGIGGAKCQPDGTGCSLHNYRIAVDIDPGANPQSPGSSFTGQMKEVHVKAVTAIRNTFGEQVWVWGGYWSVPDRMHYQFNVPPSRTSIDWTTVMGSGVGPGDGNNGGDMADNHTHILTFPAKPEVWADDGWKWWVSVGGTTIPESRTWEVTRQDISQSAYKFVRPLMAQVQVLTQQNAAITAELTSLRAQYSNVQTRLQSLEAGQSNTGSTINSLDTRVSKVEGRVTSLEQTPPGTSDPNAIKSGDTVTITRNG